MNWEDCKNAFHDEMLLRDIYVQDITTREWSVFLSFLKCSTYNVVYKHDGEVLPLPTRISDEFDDTEHSPFLSIDIGGTVLHCYFFSDVEIEVDLVAREIKSQGELDEILEFMRSLGKHLVRDVILTEESMAEEIWFKYLVEDDQIRFTSLF